MATKIRLQRRGRKHYEFYSIVSADSRSPRDGKCTEKLGTYNPNTNPATVELNFERALWCYSNRHCTQHPFTRGRVYDEAPPGRC